MEHEDLADLVTISFKLTSHLWENFVDFRSPNFWRALQEIAFVAALSPPQARGPDSIDLMGVRSPLANAFVFVTFRQVALAHDKNLAWTVLPVLQPAQVWS